ncbi:hypothetical protein BDP27DRAFT_1372798 [Rhodocollybia butyracea]|uniref:Uncharacterized protein n=1 Tax=Rhodocollybia butyracea TaxID=206335 RepID=A0A9P5P7U0_9AGAR|nr:hypothetical protein BDP27DRAFT_1372798 [Rhodocollybia butyracea]
MTLLLSELESKELPIAEGGWIAANSSYYGAKVKRNLEDMKAKGFTHVPWKGRWESKQTRRKRKSTMAVVTTLMRTMAGPTARATPASMPWGSKGRGDEGVYQQAIHAACCCVSKRSRRRYLPSMATSKVVFTCAALPTVAPTPGPISIAMAETPQKGDKRVSFTQYTAGEIHRWLEYGGRTEEQFATQDPEGFEQMMKDRPGHWHKVLGMFSTIDKL